MAKQKHVCGLTGKVFNSRKEYLEHVSPVSGYAPTDIRHHGVRALQIAKAAITRGVGKLSKTKEAEIDAQIAEVQEAGVDHKLMEAKRDRTEAKNIRFEEATE